MNSTRGADWKGGGELKALQRIVPSAVNEDDVALPPKDHNKPADAVHAVSAEEVELEAQALVVENALSESAKADDDADHRRIRAGRELLRIQQIFLNGAERRRRRIRELRDSGMTWKEVGQAVGFTAQTVRSSYVATSTFGPTSYEGKLFTTWATHRFGLTKPQLQRYLSYGRDGKKIFERARINAKNSKKRTAHFAQLVRAEEAKKVTPALFKKAFMALQPPARRATLLWACSTMVGSDDPQEIARWFAAAQDKRK